MKLEPKHKKAALRLAEGRWTDTRIAEEAGVARVNLWRWTKDAAFAALVAEHRATLYDAVVKSGIADKQTRVAGQVERHQLFQQIIEARAARGRVQLEAYESGKTPGGLPRPEGEEWAKLDRVPAEVVTGLIVRQEKSTPFGTTVEWVVDTGLTAEMRATEKQVAQELGEWTEKSKVEHDASDSFLDALRSFAGDPPGQSG